MTSRICRVCKTDTTDYEPYARTCNSCKSKDLCKCTSCGLAKPKTSFYKNNYYGACIACRVGKDPDYVPRPPGFKGLDKEVQEGIITMLYQRKLYDATDGKAGIKYKRRDITRKYGLSEASLSLWIQKKTIPVPDLKPSDIDIDKDKDEPKSETIED